MQVVNTTSAPRDRQLGALAKPRPVFNIDRRCSAAMRRIAAFIEERAEIAKAEITAGFQRARRDRGLPPIMLTGWKHYRLPQHFECPECGGRVCFEVDEWSTATGIPTAGGIRVMCVAEEEELDRAMQADEDPAWEHKHWQSTGWMELIRRVERFCASNVRVETGGA
ncbi:hypothetical protein ACQ858_19705 [Variovorax ureilyticus]|uniref:hypothetical protein n=1 Tax=Variovorax ureilyticus TaxID=1836198 RepID=UPI003D6708D7